MKKDKPTIRVQCKKCPFVHINPWNGHQAWCMGTGKDMHMPGWQPKKNGAKK